MSKGKVVVLGGYGYLGSYLCEKLISRDYDVTIIDRCNYAPPTNMSFLQQFACNASEDFIDSTTLNKCLKDGVDYLIDLAALVGEGVCNKFRDEAIRTNRFGTKYLVSILKQNYPDTKLIYASTASNYGIHEGLADESCPLNPKSLYAETKVESEKIVQENLENYTIFRFGTLFGVSPRMRWDLMLNEWCYDAYHRGVIKLYNKNANRPLLHLNDASEAIEESLWNINTDSEVYNVAVGNFTKKQIADTISEVIPCSIVVHPQSTDVRDYAINTKKWLSVTSRKSKMTTISDGVKELLCHMNGFPKNSNAEEFELL